MKAAELRKSILQAAVQGKLVPQNIHDEPATELLKRIQQEKERLITEGKIKKAKPLPPISEEEIPYDVPEGWVWCRLGELIVLAENNNIHKTMSPDEIVNYVDIDAVDNENYVVKAVKQLPVSRLSSRARRVLTKDSIIYSLVRPYLNNIAIIEDDKPNYIGSTGFVVFKTIQIPNKYFMTVLLSPYIEGYYLSLMSGFNSPSISMDEFLKTPFPLPPLDEQKRIIAKVDEFLALCKEFEYQERELDKLEDHFVEYLPKSILQAAVQGKLVPQNIHDEPATELLKRIQQEKERLIIEGKIKKEKPLPPISEEEIPYDLPEGWIWCRLGEVIILTSGQHIEASEYNTIGEGIAYLTGPTDFGQKYTVISKWTTKPKVCVEKGDILITVKGSGVGSINFLTQNAAIGRQLMSIKPIGVNKSYVFYFLMTNKSYYSNKKTGIAIPGISRDDILNTLFPLPPLFEQKRIVKKIEMLLLSPPDYN